MNRFLVLLAVVAAAYGQTFNCPDDFGFYPHQTSCDRYWKCDEGIAELKTCGNGLAFDDTDTKYLTENCDYLYNVDCGARSEIEPPIATTNCPRLFGVFPDEERCDVFWNCWNGEANRYQCSPGLAYDRVNRVCMWADKVPECRVEEVGNGFACPPLPEDFTGTFTRHAHPEDCRKYYVCIQGIPREYGCPVGTVFRIGDNSFSGSCSDPEDVPGCEDYYGDLDLKLIKRSQLLLGLGLDNNQPSQKSEDKPTAAKKPSFQSRVRPSPAVQPNPIPPNVQDQDIEYEYVYEDEIEQ